jgi:hypothetical protein
MRHTSNRRTTSSQSFRFYRDVVKPAVVGGFEQRDRGRALDAMQGTYTDAAVDRFAAWA